MTSLATISPAEFRLACRNGQYQGTTRGVALGYLQCNLVIVSQEFAYDFLLYCQRNTRACPVLEVCDTGDPCSHDMAPGADLRTDLPRYAVYRAGVRQPDVTDIRDLWRPDAVCFLIGSGISFDHALEEAGISTTRDRWVLRSSLPTRAAGIFHGSMIVTMRWLSPTQAIDAVQVTARYPLNHGAPVHIGDPALIGARLDEPLVGSPVDRIPEGVVPVFWACGVTPQQAALEAKLDWMITHAPAHGFVTDRRAREFALP